MVQIMDPFVTGSLISAGSSLLGGIFGSKSQKNAAAREMDQKIQTGKKYGLHASTSIGAQTSGYQPVMNQAFTSAGRSIQGLAARADAKADRAREDRGKELLDAQIAEAQSRTILNKANAQRALVGPGAPTDPYAPRKANALISVKLENGDTVLVPNPDVYEISPTELATGRLVLEGGRVVDNARNPAPRSTGTSRRSYRTGR